MEHNEHGECFMTDILYGQVYKSRSSWWYTVSREGSSLNLSSKFKTKAKAKAHALSKLQTENVDVLHIYNSNDKLQYERLWFRKRGFCNNALLKLEKPL